MQKDREYFYKKVNLRSRKAMISFLSGHFRYYTMKPWNKETSYANCIKLHGIYRPPSVDMDTWYGMLETNEWEHNLHFILNEFEDKYDWQWQIGTNGRSGGYLVLYQGGKDPSSIKLFTRGCGTDQEADYETWDMSSLIKRTKLIQDFDKTCDEVVNAYVTLCIENKVVNGIEYVAQPTKVLQRR